MGRMCIYLVKRITEADYGCEDTGRDEPMALLFLEPISIKSGRDHKDVAVVSNDNASGGKRVEVSEAFLAKYGISEGKKVVISENGEIRKCIRVVAAIIISENSDKKKMVFATQRGYGEFKDGWEFPGGKIEDGETPEEAIVREIKEELETEIKVENYFDTIEYDYPEFHLSMDCFVASIVEGDIVLKEHEAAKWLTVDELDCVEWLPADITIIDEIRQLLQ